MWYSWEVINGKFSVVCEMQEMDPWRCTKVKRVTLRLGKNFVSGRCKKQVDDGLAEPVEKLCIGGNSKRFLLFGR